MKTFKKKVDKRSRNDMTAFLKNHFRYNTLSSWNNSTSYACNMKIHNLGLEREITNKLYELIETREFYDVIHFLIHEFGMEHNFNWQVGWNGRNGGYLVLYQGELKPSGYKSYCKECGQQNYKSVAERGNVCGVCREPSRVDYTTTHIDIHTFPGRSTDQNEDFSDWDMDSLRDRVELVCSFDRLADKILAEAVYMAENYAVKKETYQTTHTRKVMVI